MEAAYYEIDSTGWAACRLCPHHCHIAQGIAAAARPAITMAGTSRP